MKKHSVIAAVLFLTVACKKEKDVPAPSPGDPPMNYINLGNATVKFGQQKQLDIDEDNIKDFIFTTMLVGDPVARADKRQYYINGLFDTFSLVDAQEESPALNNGDAIRIQKPAGYNWYNASSIIIAQKIIKETGPDHWEGNWKNADHKFFAVQLRKGDLRYNGWIELSFKTDTEEFVFHRAAISTVPARDVTAGK